MRQHMTLDDYVNALENICQELKDRAEEIVTKDNARLYGIEIRIRLAVDSIPTYDIVSSYYPHKISVPRGIDYDTGYDTNS